MVFERFDTDVRQFLKMSPLKVSGMRHVLRCVLAALAYMHKLGFVHADLKTANIFLRGKGVYEYGWRRMLGRAMGVIPGGGAASASGCVNVYEHVELTYHLPACFEVNPFRNAIPTM